jgi:hypothetical protein
MNIPDGQARIPSETYNEAIRSAPGAGTTVETFPDVYAIPRDGDDSRRFTDRTVGLLGTVYKRDFRRVTGLTAYDFAAGIRAEYTRNPTWADVAGAARNHSMTSAFPPRDTEAGFTWKGSKFYLVSLHRLSQCMADDIMTAKHGNSTSWDDMTV